MRFLSYFFIVVLALSFAACEKDSTTISTTTTSTVAGELAPATITVYGRLTDDQGDAVENALVQAGNKSTMTDQDGLYRIENARVAATFGYVTFESAQHLKGSRTVYASEGSTYRVDVELLNRNQVYTVDAAAGGEVRIGGSDASVTFPAGAFAKTDGTPITTGEVSIIAHYLDASEEATYRQMPGDLRALATDANSNTDFTLLTSFGMMAVELTDATGAEVVLADGSEATLSMPLSAEAQANAPASIPLWYFDEVDGIWREEGQATLTNGAYVGTVTHFTFWNCDIPTEYVTLCLTIDVQVAGMDSLQLPLHASIESENWGTRSGFLNASGELCGFVPAGENLILRILGYGDCQELLYEQQIGPLSEDTDLGVIPVTPTAVSVVTLSGSASCNGVAVTSGSVRIEQSGLIQDYASIEPDGSFEITFLGCDTTDLTVVVNDYGSFTQSDPQTFAFAETIATGDIEACAQQLTNFFELIIDGTSIFGDSVNFNQDGSEYFMSGDAVSGSQGAGFFIVFPNTCLPDPLVTGLYTCDFSSGQREFGIFETELLTNGFISVQEPALLVDITGVPNASSNYTEGSIGPFQHTETDSLGVTVTHDIQIRFSAFTN